MDGHRASQPRLVRDRTSGKTYAVTGRGGQGAASRGQRTEAVSP